MNIRQESKDRMYLVVKQYLTANDQAVSELPNYLEYFTIFQGIIDEIDVWAEQQMISKKGISVHKKKQRAALVVLCADTSRRITAYAKHANDLVLLKEIRFTESELKKTADTILRDNAQGIYDRTQVNLTALEPYGLTAATQTALQNAINAFVTSIPKPRLGITNKKQSTAKLAKLFDAADEALDSIDTIIEIVRVADANFYNGYKTVRKIIELGKGSLVLKVLVTDAQTGEPLANVTLTITPDDGQQRSASQTAKQSIVHKTAKGGGLNVKSMEDGKYVVTAQKPGYKDKIATVNIVHGEMTLLEIGLEKI
ncbi:MAG: carboxypeptidase regulatory-like domain-containing protein [Bacteroidales bacterium]|nr:carboxypeptidase regulatory-like domain-containing protein [Bacteroidales bacterium]